MGPPKRCHATFVFQQTQLLHCSNRREFSLTIRSNHSSVHCAIQLDTQAFAQWWWWLSRWSWGSLDSFKSLQIASLLKSPRRSQVYSKYFTMLRETVAKMCHWKQWDGHEETGEHVSATDSCGPASLTRSDAASPVNFSPTSKSATKSSHRELGRMLFPGGDKVGIRVLYAPEKPVIDLVFIHGLKGDSYSTWLDTRSGTYWPVHLLQYDVPNARIMTFGYNADPVKGPGSVGQNDLRDHAYTLLGDLARVRRADPV